MTITAKFTSSERIQRSKDFGASMGKLGYVLDKLKEQLIDTSENDINIVSLTIMIESVEQSISIQDDLFSQELESIKIN